MNQLLEARKQMAKMMKQIGKGKMPALPGQPQVQNGAWPHVQEQTQEEREIQITEVIVWPSSIRLTRVGSKKNPVYRIVAADSRSPRDGKFIEIVGRYNPQTDPSTIEFDEAKVKDWLSKGAQPSSDGAAAAEGQELRWLRPTASTWRGGSSTSRMRCASRRSTGRATPSCSSTWRRTTSAR